MRVLDVGEAQPLGPIVAAGLSSPVMATSNLTFEQQKELLMLHLEHDKRKFNAESAQLERNKKSCL